MYTLSRVCCDKRLKVCGCTDLSSVTIIINGALYHFIRYANLIPVHCASSRRGFEDMKNEISSSFDASQIFLG